MNANFFFTPRRSGLGPGDSIGTRDDRRILRLGRLAGWVGLLVSLGMLGAAGVVSAPPVAAGLSEGTGTPVTLAETVPGFRQADNIAVITVRGEINSVTELSMKRRIAQAEASGADAMVIEVDSPGGEVGAVLEITNAIKASSISNTVAWVHPDAYSGGAIIALACSELVTSDPASMGDAFPITFGPQGVRGLSEDERTKFLPPLLSDVAESARRNGYDEYLVQAMVVDGIELWAVREAATGSWYFINEAESRMLFEGEPPRGKPLLTSVPGGRRAAALAREDAQTTGSGENDDSDGDTADNAGVDGGGPGTDEAANSDHEIDAGEAGFGDESTGAAVEAASDGSSEGAGEELVDARLVDAGLADAGLADAGLADAGLPDAGRRAFRPASETVADLGDAVTMGIETASERPVFSMADRGLYTDLVYVSDGTGPVVMRHDQLRAFGQSAALVNSDEELRAFFGASTLARSDMNWSEHLVRFLTSMPVRGVLIVVFLLALFIEMVSPGTFISGSVAVVALAALLAPPAIIGLAGWWEIAAIVCGIGLIALEIFVTPGFGVFGVAGLLSLFVGIIGTFIPDGSGGLFGGPDAGNRLIGAVATVTLATVTAGIGMYFVGRNLGSIPFFGKLVLRDPALDDVSGSAAILQAAAPAGVGPIAGDIAVAITPLRPSGRVRIGERASIDAVARRGYVEPGTRVRLLEERGFSWIVEPAGRDEPVHAQQPVGREQPGAEDGSGTQGELERGTNDG
ncbi:MAG: hypothetical protein AAF235_05610 [Planctomycetota bacterium]